MTTNITSLKSIIFTALFFAFTLIASSQASTTVHSSDGYDVNITLGTTAVIAPSTCPWGYNYNVRINYNITFTGSNIPSSLYTLQTSLSCNSQNNFTQLPLNGGSGQRVTTSNQWNSNTDCNTVTPTSLNCNRFNLVIKGPGIPNQTIVMNNGIALPVELVSFDAVAASAKVLLNWKTSAELNSSYFTVERSTDGKNWESIQTVESTNNSSSISEYSAADNSPVNGLAFYRLKQTDVNGTATILNAIQPVNFTPAISISVYPNPAADAFSIEADQISDAVVSMTDCMGKTVTVPSEVSGNSMSFNTSELPNGIYFVSVALNGNVEQQKLTVRH